MTPIDPTRIASLLWELRDTLDTSGCDLREQTVALFVLAFETGRQLDPNDQRAIHRAIANRSPLPAEQRLDA